LGIDNPTVEIIGLIPSRNSMIETKPESID
jgi:hypothetical protein